MTVYKCDKCGKICEDIIRMRSTYLCNEDEFPVKNDKSTKSYTDLCKDCFGKAHFYIYEKT